MRVGPNYRRPVVQTADNWIEADDPSVINQQQPYPDWWSVFDDPTLDQLVNAAYQQNLPLRTAGLRVLEARTQRQITAANLLPQSQNFFGQFARNQLSRNTATSSPFVPIAFDEWQTGFDLSWELDVWGRLRRAIEASDAAIAAETENYEAHQWIGCLVIVLVFSRIVWGFVGSRHSRFADFVVGPSKVMTYLRGQGAASRGHNPLGGWSVLALLLLLLLQAVSGLFNSDDVFFS